MRLRYQGLLVSCRFYKTIKPHMKYLLVNRHEISIEVNGIVEEEVIVLVVGNEIFKVNSEVVCGSNGVSNGVETVAWSLIIALETNNPSECGAANSFNIDSDVVRISIKRIDD